MTQRTVRRILTLFSLALVSATIALAQAPTPLDDTVLSPSGEWRIALQMGSHKGKVFVVTRDQPDRKQSCRIQSFTPGKLVCSRAFGDDRTYLQEQVVALILPANHSWVEWFFGANAGLGASIFGAVTLAACPACVAGLTVAALISFAVAGGELFAAEDDPQRLLYLAPGQQLSKKLGYVYR